MRQLVLNKIPELHNQVLVVHARLSDVINPIQYDLGILNSQELKRLEAFKFDRDRYFWAQHRILLRKILSRLTGSDPSGLNYTVNEYGRPSLKNLNHPLYYNVSHSADQILYAFSITREVGIDIEVHRIIKEMKSMAQRFFSPEEFQAFIHLPIEESLPAFYRIWTRKEAIIKAVGHGLSMPLDSFVVEFGKDKMPRVKSFCWENQQAKYWHLHHFDILSDVTACLAYKCKERQEVEFVNL